MADLLKEALATGVQKLLLNGIPIPATVQVHDTGQITPLAGEDWKQQEPESIRVDAAGWLLTTIRVFVPGKGIRYFSVKFSEVY